MLYEVITVYYCFYSSIESIGFIHFFSREITAKPSVHMNKKLNIAGLNQCLSAEIIRVNISYFVCQINKYFLLLTIQAYFVVSSALS